MVTRVPGGRGVLQIQLSPREPYWGPRASTNAHPTVCTPHLPDLGASWDCHEHSFHWAQSMSAIWVLPGTGKAAPSRSPQFQFLHTCTHTLPPMRSPLSTLCPRSQLTPHGS